MKWAIATLAIILAIGTTLATVTTAQVGRIQIQPSQQSHEVRLVNEMGYPIRVKMVRYGSGRYLEEDLGVNQSTTRQLYAGERVLCVWNRGQVLTLAAQINVDTSGTLRIRPIAYPYAAGPARAGASGRSAPAKRMEPLPRLKLDK